MTLALLLAALLGQTVYEWTDARGESHYTDDLSSIPKGAKVRTTEGADISVVGGAAKARDGGGAPKPAAAPRPERDRCAEAKKKVTGLEAKLAAAKQEHELALLRWSGDCQAILRTHGQAEFAKCSRRGRKSAEAPQPRYGDLERQLGDAQETLRRAQVAGCLE